MERDVSDPGAKEEDDIVEGVIVPCFHHLKGVDDVDGKSVVSVGPVEFEGVDSDAGDTVKDTLAGGDIVWCFHQLKGVDNSVVVELTTFIVNAVVGVEAETVESGVDIDVTEGTVGDSIDVNGVGVSDVIVDSKEAFFIIRL